MDHLRNFLISKGITEEELENVVEPIVIKDLGEAVADLLQRVDRLESGQ